MADVTPVFAEAAVDITIFVTDLPNGGGAYEDPTTGLPVTVVTAGSEVRWQWTGNLAHSVTHGLSAVTGPEGAFDSGVRTSADDVTLFESVGVAFEDLVVAASTLSARCRVVRAR